MLFAKRGRGMRFQVGLEVGNTISGYSELVAALSQAFSYFKGLF
jgi:hypothetical protein